MTKTPEGLFSTEQAARYLGISPRTLNNWRCLGGGKGPAFAPTITTGRPIRASRFVSCSRVPVGAGPLWLPQSRRNGLGNSISKLTFTCAAEACAGLRASLPLKLR